MIPPTPKFEKDKDSRPTSPKMQKVKEKSLKLIAESRYSTKNSLATPLVWTKDTVGKGQ